MLLLMCVACSAALAACAGDAWSGRVPGGDEASFQAFQAMVYPVLMRDCAFNACHGAEHRFFQVFGPGRQRLGLELKAEDPATMLEVRTSYERSLSMLIAKGPVTRSLLLSKPLEPRLGGVGHRGVDNFGRNVYQSAQDPNYLILLAWASSVSGSTTANFPPGTAGIGAGGALGSAGRVGVGASGIAGGAGTAFGGTAGRP